MPHPHDRPSDPSELNPEPDSIEFESTTPSPEVPRTRMSGVPGTDPPSVPQPADLPDSVSFRALRLSGVLGFVLFAPSIAALLFMMLPGIARIESGLNYPYQLDAEEGFVHLQALDLQRGQSIYTPINEEPYLVGNYPPLFPVLIALALEAGATGLPAGRIVVAVASLLIGILLFTIARVMTRRWSVALLAPLLFYVSYEFYTWSAYSRVDLPALALTLGGVLAFLLSSRRPAVIVLSALLFVGAAYTRQTAILAPVSCALALLFMDRRALAWFLIPYLGLGLGLFLGLNTWLDGEFWNHLVVYNRNAMDWGVLRSILKNEIWFFYQGWIMALAVGGAVTAAMACMEFAGSRSDANVVREPKAHDSIRPGGIFIAAYFVLSALSLSAFAKSGSAANYALEPLAASAILLIYLIGRLQDRAAFSKSSAMRWSSIVGLFAVSMCIAYHTLRVLPVNWSESLPAWKPVMRVAGILDERRVGWALFSSRNPTAEETARGDRIVSLIRQAPGDVLTEHPIFAIEAGREVAFQPFIMTTLVREGRWDAAPFVEDLRYARFDLIVTTQDLREVERGGVLARYTGEMARAILERYELAAALPAGPLGFPYYVWLPRSEAGS